MKPRASTPVSSRRLAAVAAKTSGPAVCPPPDALVNHPDPVLAELHMTPDTLRLWLRYWNQSDRLEAKGARNDIVVHLQPWVHELADRLGQRVPPHIHREDLVNEMNKRLIGLIEKYDPTHRIGFEQYAGRQLVGACHDFLRRAGWIKRTDRQFRKAAQEAREQFLSESGRDPSDEEWAGRLGLSAAAFERRKAKMHNREMTSLSAVSETGGDHTHLTDNRTVDPQVQAQRHEVVGLLCRGLQDKEREVLRAYYLLGLTMKQIGDRLALSEARVSQLHARVLKTLRIKFAGRREDLL